MKNETLSLLSDAALISEVGRLAHAEHDATVALVEHLAELGARRLYLAAGFASLFTYCREMLALSEGEAYNRVVASRAVRRFPLVLDRLADGAVNLTTIRLLHKHLTPANHRDLLDASAGKSKRDVERLVAARFPQAAVPFSVRKVSAAAPPADVEVSLPTMPADVSLPMAATVEAASVGATAADPSKPDLTPTPTRPATIRPISEDQYSVRFTASAGTWEKLQAAQDLLRHSLPDGNVGAIFDRALQLLLEDLARKKFAATDRPRPSSGTQPGSREVAAAVKRVVWVRDCARCAFVSASRRRCTERSRLEFHHVLPYAAGGEATVENIQLRCRAHNAHESTVFFGPIREGMDRVSETIQEWHVSPALSGQSPLRSAGERGGAFFPDVRRTLPSCGI
ncbi:MAG: HNH endonuclease [bacterium]